MKWNILPFALISILLICQKEVECKSDDHLKAEPVSINSLDFDEDGTADLIVDFNNGTRKLFHGTAALIYQRDKLKPRTGKSLFLNIFTAAENPPTIETTHRLEGLVQRKKLDLRLNADAISDTLEIVDGRIEISLSSPQTIFTVNQNGDQSDDNIADGNCDVDPATAGDQCTLRAAIQQANADQAADEIRFAISGSAIPIINLLNPLTPIASPVTIDGTTQPAGLIEIQGTVAGTAIDALQITSGSSVVRGLVINRIDGNAIRIATNGSTVIEGNYIGTDPTGETIPGNSESGILIDDSPNNLIGGTVAAARNIISGNSGAGGIEIRGINSIGNLIQGNYIGTNGTGTISLPNTSSGVSIQSPDNLIGGIAAGASNLISGNGIGIQTLGTEATGNLIQGNLIGTDVTGSQTLGNATGIAISSDNNQVGGTTAADRNIISGNTTGLAILGGAVNMIEGNFIGSDITGSVAVPNHIAGIVVAGPSNIIGGPVAGASNLISGNTFTGLVVIQDLSSGNQISNNVIGLQSNGNLALPNGSHGIYIAGSGGSPSSNTIQDNQIAFNGGDGVFAQSGTANRIQANSIYSNAQLGIDVGADGISANDNGDGDSGPNLQQNYPVLESAIVSGGGINIAGSINSAGSTSFVVEFFSGTTCDPSGNGEGRVFLGSTDVVTDASGNATINVTLPVIVNVGDFITATATDSSGNTSEFSECRETKGELGALFFDDFTDGDASDWTFIKGTWTVENGDLTGNIVKKGDALSPDFGGCASCTITANVRIDSNQGRVSLLGWYADKKNLVEIRLMQDRGKILLIQKSNGFKVAKDSVAMNLQFGMNYQLEVSFNNSVFQVILDGNLVLTVPAGAAPSGNVGFRIKSPDGSSKIGSLSDISVSQ